ncbi:MAG: hypothetical protein WBO55_11865 [Rhizobiaceae bacterium]
MPNPDDGRSSSFAEEARAFVKARRPTGSSLQACKALLFSEGADLDLCDRITSHAFARQTAITILRKGLARERGKARSGNAFYDFNRHLAFHQAIKMLESDDQSQDPSINVK